MNIIGYLVHDSPAPILVIQPTGAMAETFSKDRITPLFRDTPVLSDKLGTKLRDKGVFAVNNTIAHRIFPGGHLTIIGSNSPAQLASRPIKILLIDEVDRFNESAGQEGDPVMLAVKRTTTFRNRKILLTSTPTIKNESRIEKAFFESDQRYYWIPCPHCQQEQKLTWEQVRWEDENYRTARYHCLHCNKEWTDLDRWDALQLGKWKAEAPFTDIAGFHISSLYSPWVSISTIVKEYFEAKRGGQELLRVWWNTSLGLPFEEDLNQAPTQALMDKAEDFSLDRIPNEVVYLTIGGDTQDDREEITFLGWGLKKECYVLGHIVIPGQTNLSEVWGEADKLIEKDYYRKDGSIIKVSAGCFDSGGHSTLQVYEFALNQQKKGRKIYAIKGRDGSGPIWEYKARKSGTHKVHRFHFISTGTSKEALFSSLKLQSPGENYIHYSHTLTAEYFVQLTCEAPKWELRRGHPRKVWVQKPGTRREAPDCWRYGLAALYAHYTEYERHCLDYQAKMMNERKEEKSPATKSGYLERLRYR